MKDIKNPCKFSFLLLFSFLPATSNALVLDTAGHYVIDYQVDELVLSTSGITIEVGSGGVIEGDISCSDHLYGCSADIDISGHGAVLGSIYAQSQVTVRDYGTVLGQLNSGRGYVTVQDYGRTGEVIAHEFTIENNAFVESFYAHPGATYLNINGGYLGEVTNSPEPLIINMTDGTIGEIGDSDSLELNMTGGRIENGIANNFQGFTVTELKIEDGDIWGEVDVSGHIGSSYENHISGGSFNANDDAEFLLEMAGTTHLVIDGGLFGYINDGAGFNFIGGGIIDIWGRELMLMDGLLSGYLMDGNYISVGVQFNENWDGEFNLINVPAPTSLILMGIALVGFRIFKCESNQSKT